MPIAASIAMRRMGVVIVRRMGVHHCAAILRCPVSPMRLMHSLVAGAA